jgi:hypothetical protein
MIKGVTYGLPNIPQGGCGRQNRARSGLYLLISRNFHSEPPGSLHWFRNSEFNAYLSGSDLWPFGLAFGTRILANL